MDIGVIFIKISQGSILLPLIAALFNYKKIDKTFKYFMYFFIFSLFSEIQASLFKYYFHNNMPGLHFFICVEFSFFTYMYASYFIKRKLIRIVILINLFIFLLLAITDAFLINDIWHPNTLSRTYASISLVAYSLIFFYFLLKDDISYYSWEYPMFWINIGVLLYFSVNLFYFMMIKYLIENAEYTGKIGLYMHGFVNLLANILYAQSFRCRMK